MGRYHVNELIAKFLYLDAMTPDIPIIDDEARRKIKDVDAISDRLSRARIVLIYLNQCADRIRNSPFFPHWERVQQKIADEIADVEEKNRQHQRGK